MVHIEKCAIGPVHRFQNGSSVNGKRWLVGTDVIRRWRKADRICSQIINDTSFKHNQYFLCVLSAHTFRNYRYFITQTITSFSLLLFTKFCGAHSACTPYALYINGIRKVQRSSWYTGALSHNFHKNGKTYWNTDSMLVSEMKQPHMGLLQNMFFYTGKLISRSTFWKSMFDCKLKLCTHCNALVCVIMHTCEAAYKHGIWVQLTR